jgi:hypothetical protein
MWSLLLFAESIGGLKWPSCFSNYAGMEVAGLEVLIMILTTYPVSIDFLCFWTSVDYIVRHAYLWSVIIVRVWTLGYVCESIVFVVYMWYLWYRCDIGVLCDDIMFSDIYVYVWTKSKKQIKMGNLKNLCRVFTLGKEWRIFAACKHSAKSEDSLPRA